MAAGAKVEGWSRLFVCGSVAAHHDRFGCVASLFPGRVGLGCGVVFLADVRTVLARREGANRSGVSCLALGCARAFVF
eukprot:914166-Prymnesium_polylepis.2